jgi:hypothetical protein
MTLELWRFSMGLGGGDLRGMSVEALDGSVGKVENVVDQLGGAYLVVDTGGWIFGKTVVVPAGVVRAVDPDRRCVFVACTRADVKGAPEHDPDAGEGATREALGAYYGEVRRRDDRAQPDSATEPTVSAASTRPHAEESAAPSFARSEADMASPAEGTAARTGPDAMPAAHGAHDTAGRAAVTSDESRERPIDRPLDAVSPGQSGERSAEPDRPDVATTSPTRRFTRESDDERSTSGGTRSGDRSRSNRGGRTSSAQPPIARYDSLTAAEVIARLRNLSQRELASLAQYEERHEGRQTVLSRIDALREDEPWRGYDDATVPEIRRTLADADEDRAKAVRDYERRHRDRKGVMDAARRIVASA